MVTQWQNAEFGDLCEQCAAPLDDPWGDEGRARVFVVYADRSYENCLGIYCGTGCAREAELA